MPAKTLIEDLVIRYGFQVLGALVVLAVGFLAARWAGSLTERRLRAGTMEPPLRLLLVRVVRLLVLMAAAMVALDQLGFQIAPLVAAASVAGIGIGLAMQGVLANIVAGLTIILTKPFRVGEYIKVAGVDGEVVHIDLQSTVLAHADRSRVVVPNRRIVGEILHNFGVIRQLSIGIGVVNPADVTRALEAVQQVLARNPRVLRDPAAVFGVGAIGEGAIRINVAPWVAAGDFGPAGAELYVALIEEFRARDVNMGVSREIRVVNGAAPLAAVR
jgi:small conductance mechanosensitive channel